MTFSRSVIARLSIQYGTFQHLVERGLSFSVNHRERCTDELLPRSVVFDPLWLLEIHQWLEPDAALYPQCVGLSNALDWATQEKFHSSSFDNEHSSARPNLRWQRHTRPRTLACLPSPVLHHPSPCKPAPPLSTRRACHLHILVQHVGCPPTDARFLGATRASGRG